ncbi:ABC transporter permease [Prauserella endophytica]|uniref:ABC transporter permease n=1 Tax=Prauserella endophytica TaxID=1592324 RepID=A0ABY2SB37_9PSEU|nr:ABC transporter permease [Prauserella endophytica]TKG72691.1 ABC transporter permease [Prauserella endophytica]
MSRWGMPAPWSRAPLMLLRRPVVALAVAVGALLVAMPAAAAPLFLSSAGNATLRQLVDASCTWQTGMHLAGAVPTRPTPEAPGDPVGEDLVDRRVELVRARTGGLDHLSEPVVTLLTPASVGPAAAPDQSLVTLAARDGFREHVDVVAGGQGRGLWLPDRFAGLQGLSVGDEVTLSSGDARVTMPVAAVFRDLRSVPELPFWCSLRETIHGAPLSDAPVFPMAFVSRGDLLAVAGDTGASMWIERAVDTGGLTTVGARPSADGLERLRADTVGSPEPGLFDDSAPYGGVFTSSLADKVNRSELVLAALTGTVGPLAGAGTVAGLVIAAAAGAFWADRRRAELAVLSARGVGPVALGGKAALETAGAVALGAVAGWAGARGLVAAAGPSPLVTPGATTASLVAAATALVAALAVIAGVAGFRAGRLHDTRPARRRRRGRVPWEILPLGAAVVCWFALDAEVQVRAADAVGTVARIPPRLIVAPILLAIGLAMLGARLVRWTLRRLRSRPRSMARPAVYLAARRVVAAPLVASVLVGATAVPVALAGYGATVTGSVDRTMHAEGQLIVGTDAVLSLKERTPVPPELAGRASVVTRYVDGRLGDTTVHVLGVDPETFAGAAFWDPALPGPSLNEVLGQLSGEPTGAAVAGMSSVDTGSVLTIRNERRELDLVDVAQLPGKQAGYPLVLVDRALLDELAPSAQPQLWARGDPGEIVAAASAAGLPVSAVARAEDVQASGVYAGITYTFAFLAAVSLLTGVVIVVGLLLYLDARSRARRSASVLLRRMGIGAAAHWRALLLEVGGLLLAGFATGAALAAAVIALTAADYDLNPATSPGTLVALPWPVFAVLAVATALTAVLASAAAQRAASAARPSGVLRDTR